MPFPAAISVLQSNDCVLAGNSNLISRRRTRLTFCRVMSSLPHGAASRGSSAAATTTADKHAVMVNTTRRLSVHSAHGPLGVLLCLRYCNPPLTLLTHTLSGPDTQTHSDLSQVCGFFLSLLCFFSPPLPSASS